MPDTEKQAIADSLRPRELSERNGCRILLFTIVFSGFGTYSILASLGIVSPKGWSRPDAVAAGALFGIPCFLCGLFFLVQGFRAIARNRRRRRFLDERDTGREPWLADFPWNPLEAPDDSGRLARRQFLFSGVFALFLLPAHCLLLAPWQDEMLILILVLLLLDSLLAGQVAKGFWILARTRKFGQSRLRFPRFPFFLGERIEVRFLNDRLQDIRSAIRFTLRHVEERYEFDRNMRHRNRLVRYQVWADSTRPGEAGTGDACAIEIPVSFDLPTGDFGTFLSGHPPRYWELVAETEPPGLGFRATFLVPVYARPSAPASS